MKRSFFARVSIILIMVFCIFIGYTKALELPVFADATTEEWQNVTTNEELAEAFRYYCKSRDLTIDGSIADGVTKFTTQTFNGIVNVLGIDVTALQANLKKSTDKNGRLQFLFNQSGISTYNRIFSQFLQDNDLSVGDTADAINNIVYSGELITDSNGVSCLVTIINSQNFVDVGTKKYYVSTDSSEFLYYGSKYLLDGYEAYAYKQNYPSTNPITYQSGFYSDISHNTLADISIHLTSSRPTVNNYYYIFIVSNAATQSRIYGGDYNLETITYNGYVTVIHNSYNDRYYLGSISNNSYLASNLRIYPVTTENTDIYLTTNNATINNNTYESNTYTTINEDGQSTSSDSETPPPPSGGGGGGDSTTIDFPDFDFNIPDLNFSLGDLSLKFPFCIPFDMIALLTLLNGEPQAPHIQGSIPITSHYTWQLDMDFSRFDDFATIMRGLEFVGFLFFLVTATINIAKG